MQRQINHVQRSSESYNEAFEKIREKLKGGDSVFGDEVLKKVESEAGSGGLESLGGSGQIGSGTLEAIVLAELRPAYFIVDDRIKLKDSPVAEEPGLVAAVKEKKEELDQLSRSVGRVDLYNHWSLEYGGTGWLIDDDIVVTNRHVASLFAEKDWNDHYAFKKGAFDREMEAKLNFIHQHDSDLPRRRAEVLEVLYIAGRKEADIAFLRVRNVDDTPPLALQEEDPREGLPVATIGYPASDSGRNDPKLMAKLFGDVFNLKRFSPGYVTGTMMKGLILKADYTSLGGNSGGPVINLESGEVVGLHFAGVFRDTNYAVVSRVVAAALRARAPAKVVVEAPKEDPSSKPVKFSDRDGYDSTFLGEGEKEVPLPYLGAWYSDVAEVSDDDDNVLKYRHFSVIQSKSRRLPLLTAVNIDGEKAYSLKRKGTWKLDGRIAKEDQIGNVLYRYNALDRGHMVRRMDPGWGSTREEAQEGEIDTFHYTNSVPQHEDLNQKDWVRLEDYVLESATTEGFKLSVFTGPIFSDSDKSLREQPGAEKILIPEEFWKVVVMVNADTGRLSATGYILSHGEMIRNLTEAAFVYGEYKTYQVQIAKIESETSLDFGSTVRNADPLGAELDTESPFGQAVRSVEGPGSLIL